MSKIRKILLVLLLSLSLYGCAHNGSNDIDSKEYNNLKQVLLKNNYQGTRQYQIELTKSNDLYAITISNPVPKMNKLQVMALPLNTKVDDMLPNFNIIEKQDLTSFYHKQKKIRINYFNKADIKNFKVLLKYQVNKKQYLDIVNVALK